jgi:ectoine hydroxylase-related dioxygenase (phytanoyl-CoA dioxygenase family)
MNSHFDEVGFHVRENILTQNEIRALLSALVDQKREVRQGGIRRIEQLVPAVKLISESEKILSIAEHYLKATPQFVRAIYFDKTPESNWSVAWHQDKTVIVSDRFESPEWGPWSRKADVWHVQPPLVVLENMITVRLHLDRSTMSNGCLKFIPGSHKQGLMKSQQVHQYVQQCESAYCEAPIGSVLVMRPHIFHASEKSINQEPRRVLHFEYSSYVLPEGISWSA